MKERTARLAHRVNEGESERSVVTSSELQCGYATEKGRVGWVLQKVVPVPAGRPSVLARTNDRLRGSRVGRQSEIGCVVEHETLITTEAQTRQSYAASKAQRRLAGGSAIKQRRRRRRRLFSPWEWKEDERWKRTRTLRWDIVGD